MVVGRVTGRRLRLRMSDRVRNRLFRPLAVVAMMKTTDLLDGHGATVAGRT